MEYNLAVLTDRVKAAVIDSIILIAMMYGATELLSLFDAVSDNTRMGIFIIVFFLYDPILTASFGGTIGHSKAGIMVKKEKDNSKNISFPYAIVRFLIKLALGWISLLTVTANEKRKALHDMAVGSIVLKTDEV